MRASAIVGSCIFPSSLPRSVSRQLMSPSLEKSTRETPSSPPEATPRPECRPEIDEAIELCSFLVWRLSYLPILLPPERTLLCESTRRRGIVSDEVHFWWSGPLLADTVEKVLAYERNFSAPPVRPTRGDVRDHIDLHKSNHGSSYLPYRGAYSNRES